MIGFRNICNDELPLNRVTKANVERATNGIVSADPRIVRDKQPERLGFTTKICWLGH